MVADVHLVVTGLTVPSIKYEFTLPCVKVDIGPQDQLAGRRHDMLALLILIYRVGEVISLFKQHMRQT